MDQGRPFKDWLWKVYRSGDYESQRAFAKAAGSDIATVSRMMDYDLTARPSARALAAIEYLTAATGLNQTQVIERALVVAERRHRKRIERQPPP